MFRLFYSCLVDAGMNGFLDFLLINKGIEKSKEESSDQYEQGPDCLLFLHLKIARPPIRLQGFGRFVRVVLNRTDIPITGLRQWMTIEVRFIEFAQVYRFAT